MSKMKKSGMKLCRDVTRNEREMRGRKEGVEKEDQLGLVSAAIKTNAKVTVALKRLLSFYLNST